MAEFAGTLNLGNQFLTAIKEFGLVHIGRNCTSDYETCALRMACARFRLAEWGQSVGLSVGAHPDAVFTYNDMMKKRTERLLRQINRLFDRVRESQDDYADGLPKSARQTYEPTRDLTAEPLLLYQQLDALALKRSNVDDAPVTAKPNRPQWTLYEEKAYRKLIADVVDLIDDVTKQSPERAGARERQRDLCKDAVDEMKEQGGNMDRLEGVAKKIYGDLYKVITKGTAHPDPEPEPGAEGEGEGEGEAGQLPAVAGAGEGVESSSLGLLADQFGSPPRV